jgi:hypothetical protein
VTIKKAPSGKIAIAIIDIHKGSGRDPGRGTLHHFLKNPRVVGPARNFEMNPGEWCGGGHFLFLCGSMAKWPLGNSTANKKSGPKPALKKQ